MKRLLFVAALLHVAALSLVSGRAAPRLVQPVQQKRPAPLPRASDRHGADLHIHSTANASANVTSGRLQGVNGSASGRLALARSDTLANASETRRLPQRNHTEQPQPGQVKQLRRPRWPDATDEGDKPLIVAHSTAATRFFRVAHVEEPANVTEMRNKEAPPKTLRKDRFGFGYKVMWAAVLALLALGVYILCIPFILTLAKRRPRPAFSS